MSTDLNCSESLDESVLNTIVVCKRKNSTDSDESGDVSKRRNDGVDISEISLKRSKQFIRMLAFDDTTELSPISELTVHLVGTKIGTPTSSKSGSRMDSENMTHQVPEDNNICSTAEKTCSDANARDSNDDQSLISNNFTLSTNGGLNLAGRRAEPRARNAHRRLNIAPLDLNFDEMSGSMFERNNMMPIDELSFYSGNSPRTSPRPCPPSPVMDIGFLPSEGSPQRFTVVHNTVTMVEKHRLLEEADSSSIDSNYESFRFPEPQLPKRLDPSPRKMHDIMQLQQQIHQKQHQTNKTSPKNFRVFHSLSSGSMESMDDDYMELFEMEELEEEANFPIGLNSLISGDIKATKNTPEMKRPLVRRCLSLTENCTSRARSMLFEPKTPEILKPMNDISCTYSSPRPIDNRCFKRPEPPSIISPIQSKRYKPDYEEKENTIINVQQQIHHVPRPILKKSISLNDAHIMTALARSSSEPDLIGDFSKPFCLPLTEGRHRDLKSISSETMANLIRGDFLNSVASFKIIDCRYPYEFNGGHIHGAQNLYTQEQILEELVNCKTESPTVQAEEPKRHILVFHCEFSSERGPKLSRFLRSNDRQRNTSTYPALHYPEIYLLHGGYKEFYENFPNLCDPIEYVPMLHPSYSDDYRQCRAKSKSWNGEVKSSGTINRLMKSRSRLVL